MRVADPRWDVFQVHSVVMDKSTRYAVLTLPFFLALSELPPRDPQSSNGDAQGDQNRGRRFPIMNEFRRRDP